LASALLCWDSVKGFGRALDDRDLTPALFRVFAEGEGHHAVVAVHGWLTAPMVGELALVVAMNGPSVGLDLTHLAGADQAGLGTLRRLRGVGVPLSGVRPHIEVLLGARP
jgi:hypothetical protein